jgi:NADH:quinone reductase (non-electrogenic)
MESGAADDAAFPLGQCVGLIDDLPSCAELMARMAEEARELISQRLSRIL